MNDDVMVVATYAEAERRGCHRSFGMRVDNATGAQVISVAAGPRAIDGMKVARVFWTEAALNSPGAETLSRVLRRSQAKSGYREP